MKTIASKLVKAPAKAVSRYSKRRIFNFTSEADTELTARAKTANNFVEEIISARMEARQISRHDASHCKTSLVLESMRLTLTGPGNIDKTIIW